MTQRRQIVVLAAVALATGALLSYAMARWLQPYGAQLSPLTMKGQWISAADDGNYSTCFRKTVTLTAGVSNAWISIAACDAFEIIINGDTAGRQFLWRPTRPFQNGLSESGQKLGYTLPMLGLNYPREYQWSGHRNDLFPVFIDIGPFLKAGRNSICVEVESRSLPPKLRLDGEVLLSTGTRIPLESGTGWKAVGVPPDGSLLNWCTSDYNDLAWPAAVLAATPSGNSQRSFDPRLFTEPFHAPWLRAPQAPESSPVLFEQSWDLESSPQGGWLRIVANRGFDLFLNGRRINAAAGSNLDGGDWIIDTQKVADLPMMPELLDPDEVDATFVGSDFTKPPHTDPTANDFHPFENMLNRTRERPDATSPDTMPGELEPMKVGGRTSQPFEPSAYAPSARTPKALTRNRQLGCFNLYDIRWMLKRGHNTLCVRLIPSDSVTPFNWRAQIAVDAEAVFRDGQRSTLPASGWSYRSQTGEQTYSDSYPAQIAGPALSGTGGLPKKVYRGCMFDATTKLTAWLGIAAVVFGGEGIALAFLILFSAGSWREHLGELTAVMLVPLAVLLAACLVEASWGERHESMYFRQGATWASVIALAGLLTAAAGLRFAFPTRDRLARFGKYFANGVQLFPHTIVWKFLIVILLMACGFLRAYKLDLQPLDDDEYASVEAVFAIADHGVPQYTPDVYYTRSPLYHYLTGGVVAIFGKNLWAVRLPGVTFAVATAFLTYLCGARLLGSRWIGLGALILFSLHPYTIFSAHIGRFYQQQQFFAFLTIYWFCRGMVTEQSMRHRYLMLAAFLGAVLSQELSMVLILPIAAGYILFAEKKPWADEIRFLLAAGCVLALVAVDLAVFQTVCLTRTEGVSPNIEPTLKPNFFYPMNFFTMLIAYSRLHLALSVLLLLGFPFAIRERNRCVVALYFLLITSSTFTILLVTSGSLRYQYWLIPLWILLGLQSTKALLAFLVSLPSGRTTRRHAWLDPMLGCLLFSAVALSFSPWRIPASYDAKLLPDSTSAFRYVSRNLRPGDAVTATEPHPHAALLETGQVDYDLSVPLLHDFVYQKGNRLIDRNGGAEVISGLGQLQDACAKHDRLWVVINREKFRSRGRNIRWEYPGARVELFLRENFQVKYRSALWTVYFRDSGRGVYHNFRQDRSSL